MCDGRKKNSPKFSTTVDRALTKLKIWFCCVASIALLEITSGFKMVCTIFLNATKLESNYSWLLICCKSIWFKIFWFD